jgi:methylmalonyl-CoA/ethylmalonyl-CoA epimerase
MTDLVFHHLGVACRDISKEAESWFALGYDLEGLSFEDPHQGITGQFLKGPGPCLELLQALPGQTVLDAYLSKDIKLYHHGYQTDNLELSIEKYKINRAKLVSPPFPSVAFEGRRIAFLLFPNMHLVELIEMDK